MEMDNFGSFCSGCFVEQERREKNEEKFVDGTDNNDTFGRK